MKLSVIIPTYNRAKILKTCLERLIIQEGVDFEIIVVDDGSTDHTADVVSEVKMRKPRTDVPITYIYQENAHQGAARNNGAKKATGDILLFIGDDIFAEPGFLMQHMNIHTLHSEEQTVVLGHTTWDPELEITPYMKFLESSGWQFAYHLLKPGFTDHPEPYKFFYMSNLSMKKSLFEKEQFNLKFKQYGWEDTELGYRCWAKHELRLYYEPDAKALHHHYMDDSALPKRMQTVGRSAVLFQKLQPKVEVMPKGLKALLIKIATHSVTLPLTKLFGKNTYYKFRSWREFMKGIKMVTDR